MKFPRRDRGEIICFTRSKYLAQYLYSSTINFMKIHQKGVIFCSPFASLCVGEGSFAGMVGAEPWEGLTPSAGRASAAASLTWQQPQVNSRSVHILGCEKQLQNNWNQGGRQKRINVEPVSKHGRNCVDSLYGQFEWTSPQEALEYHEQYLSASKFFRCEFYRILSCANFFGFFFF